MPAMVLSVFSSFSQQNLVKPKPIIFSVNSSHSFIEFGGICRCCFGEASRTQHQARRQLLLRVFIQYELSVRHQSIHSIYIPSPPQCLTSYLLLLGTTMPRCVTSLGSQGRLEASRVSSMLSLQSPVFTPTSSLSWRALHLLLIYYL